MSRLIIMTCLMCIAAPSWGFDMTRKDRLAVLFSNQVIFDRKGEPLVSVRITESQDKIEVKSAHRLMLLPGGDDGSQVKAPPRSHWTVTVENGQAGVVRWWTVVERFPASDVEAAVSSRMSWKSKGHAVKLFESGALLGIAGQTFDTRMLTVAVDPLPTKKAAEANARQLTNRGERPVDVISELVKRPSGWLVAREKKSKFEIRTKDLLWLTPQDGKAIEVPNLEWGVGTPRRGRDNRKYRGDVYLTVGQDGQLTAVNLLSAEKLLEGVVPSELFPSAPQAALRAQAIAARNQLLVKVGSRHRSDPYLLCAETHCQVYSGNKRRNKRTTKAVRDTRGQLLFSGDGLVDTTYSSSCGGHSEAFHVMWGGPAHPSSPGIHDVKDGSQEPLSHDRVAHFIKNPPNAFCAESGGRAGVFRWKVDRSGAKVSRKINRLAAIGPVHTIKPLNRGRSGRVLAVEYEGPRGKHVVNGAYANRKLLGNLRSGMWLVSRRGGARDGEPVNWTFEGGGFGHGVGLCQHGALGMARKGHEHEQILQHYYPGSGLRQAW